MEAWEVTLPRDVWEPRRLAHQERVRPWVADRVGRMRRAAKHPVYDFLFEYYAFRPAHLERWSPGVGVRLEAAETSDWPQWFRTCGGGMGLSASAFPRHRLDYLRWAIRYLETTQNREPIYGCFGLHEWAMVYREEQIRHRVPLRLTRDETDSVVENGALRCTHFDAFRFFTPAAVPRNRFQLDRHTTTDHDQPGCVHVTMDLYKFGFKIAPFASAELLADAFEVAVSARELDMRASPYDLRQLGFEPIRIETRDGREEYAAGQRRLFEMAKPVRERLLAVYRGLANASDFQEFSTRAGEILPCDPVP